MEIDGDRTQYLRSSTSLGNNVPAAVLRAIESLLAGRKPDCMALCQEQDEDVRTWHFLALDASRLIYVRGMVPAHDFEAGSLDDLPESSLEAWTQSLNSISRVRLISTSSNSGGRQPQYALHFAAGEPLIIPPVRVFGASVVEIERLVGELLSRL